MRQFVQFAAGLLIATSALANDSFASTGAGGLVLRRTDTVDMISEDLFVSAGDIRIRYVFRNRTPADIQTIVAFPIPDRDLGREYRENVAYPSDFVTTADGGSIVCVYRTDCDPSNGLLLLISTVPLIWPPKKGSAST